MRGNTSPFVAGSLLAKDGCVTKSIGGSPVMFVKLSSSQKRFLIVMLHTRKYKLCRQPKPEFVEKLHCPTRWELFEDGYLSLGGCLSMLPIDAYM
jgi:hypothetical protein